jgi:hypothetical protein
MPNPLTPEEKKARRAEINRQNAQKSTGPKSAAGKANSRLNGLKNGTRAVTIDLGAGAGLSLVTGEDPAAYRDMTAEYQRVLGPANRVESNLVQRIVDAQWRLLRNAKLQTLEFEAGLEEARQIDHPDVPATGVHLIDSLNANRVAQDAKYLRRLELEENRLLRIIKMTYAELKELRKLDPLPLPPIRRRIECIGKPAAILAETRATMAATMAAAEEAAASAEPTQLAETNTQTAPVANDRSQPAAALPAYPKPFGLSLDEPAQPKTFAAGAGSLYGELDPV